MANVNLSQRDMDYIGRVVATEVPASLQRTAPDQYKAMVEAVVDTITNRVASTGFPNTVEGVVNQNRQFSKIAGPSNLNPYGTVDKAPKASASLQKMVEGHLVQRANGKPSTVGNSVNYANPNYSTPNNLGWIADMANAGGVTLGVGDAIHVHGNAPGAKVPDNYTLSVPGAIGNPSQMDSKNIGYSPSRNPGTPRMDANFAQDRTFRNIDGTVFTTPESGVAARLADQLGRYQASKGPANNQSMARPTAPNVGGMPRNPQFPDRVIAPTPRPNVAPAVNPAEIARMRDNLTSRMAFAQPNPSNMNISGYGFATPAKPSGPSATGSATGNINKASTTGSVAVPARTGGVLGGRGNINPPNVVAAPANVLSNFDQYGNFTGNRQSSAAPTSDFRSTLQERAAVPQRSAPNPTAFAPGPTSSKSVQNAQAGLAKSNARDQFARDIIKGMPVEVSRAAPQRGPTVSTWGSMAAAAPISAPPSRQTSSLYDMIDVPQSKTIASQYASYGAGKIAPQVASTATQASPVAPAQRQAAPQTVGPRSPTVAPSLTSPQAITDAAKSRFDVARPGVMQGIPPSDIYDQNAPGRSGFKGFGAGGFLGNLLTGNIGNMQGLQSRGIGGLLGALLGGAVAGVPGALAGAALGNRAPEAIGALAGGGNQNSGASGGPSGGNQGNFGMGGFGFGGGGGFNSVGGGMGYGSGSAFGGGYN